VSLESLEMFPSRTVLLVKIANIPCKRGFSSSIHKPWILPGLPLDKSSLLSYTSIDNKLVD
jgi:hypothetical protein